MAQVAVDKVAFALGRGVAAFRHWQDERTERRRAREEERARKEAEAAQRRELLKAEALRAYEAVITDGPLTQARYEEELAKGRQALLDFMEAEIVVLAHRTADLVNDRHPLTKAERCDVVYELVAQHLSALERHHEFRFYVTDDAGVRIVDQREVDARLLRLEEEEEERRRQEELDASTNYVIGYRNRSTHEIVNEGDYTQRHDHYNFDPIHARQ